MHGHASEDGDAELGQAIGQRVQVGSRKRAQAIGVADDDAALHAVLLREVADAFDLPASEIAQIVQMDVDRPPEAVRHAEDGFQRTDRIAVDHSGVDASHDIHAEFERQRHEFDGSGCDQHAALGEGDVLDVDQRRVLLPQGQHLFDVAPAEQRLRVDMAADVQRTLGNAVLDQRAGPLGERRSHLVAQHGMLVRDAVPAGGAGAVGAPGHVPQGLVEMHMGLDQGRQQQLPLAIDEHRQLRGGLACRNQRADPFALQENVHGRPTQRADVPDDLRLFRHVDGLHACG